ncbi:MAG: acyl-CoA dehydrogenase family protein [Gemmatimonadales bacterium]|nr:acyl-CoA dehydrogenase family protein [Gemmatimonadales bacterium]MDZ4388470.1 acyl-CoA dehydrogenase family protein [Gemmatimonadales bacterium]
MNFDLAPEQQQIRQMVRDFAAAEIKPHIMEWDEAQTFPLDVIKQLGGLGLLGAIFPERYGGAGLSYIDYVNVLEELAACESGIALAVAAHNSLATGHIYLAGSEEQRQRYLPRLTSGEWLGCWALTEPGSGSDAAGLVTTAVREGDEWVLNGTKNFITNASHAQVAVVLAVTDRNDSKRGVTAFAIEMDRPGIRAGKKENKLGMRTSDTAELVLENCRVPHANVLGEIGYGFIDAMKVLDGGRISIAALSLGIARGAYDAARKYAAERQAFGKPIAHFQAIQFMLADMAMEIEAARLLCYRAAALKDAGEKTTQWSSMAKLYASEVAVRATEKTVQIFGGYGFIKEFPAEKYYRDVKLCTIGEGTSEIQRMVIARNLLAE